MLFGAAIQRSYGVTVYSPSSELFKLFSDEFLYPTKKKGFDPLLNKCIAKRTKILKLR
jgi:hypothetical protein